MIIRNVTEYQLKTALKGVNQLFFDNIEFLRFERIATTTYKVRLRAKDSRGPGARISFTGRHVPFACWHVHGLFFDILFALNDDAVVESAGQRIESILDNWQDWNIGSRISPLYFSEACECGEWDSPVNLDAVYNWAYQS